METNEEKLIRLQKLEDCIRSLYMEIPCEATPELRMFFAFIVLQIV